MKYCMYLDGKPQYIEAYKALRLSLETFVDDGDIFTLAIDQRAARELPNVSNLILADDVVTKELLATKSSRSDKEYIWTMKASWILWVLENCGVQEITYLDVDTYFFSDPDPVNQEVQKHSVAITPHRFAPKHEHFVRNGIFNIGYVYFKNDETGRAACGRWSQRCIEWCYHRHEGNRFTEQRYLDAWPEDWNAYIIKHKGFNLAPWNQIQYEYEIRDNQIYVGGDPLIFYHFHGGIDTGYQLHPFVKEHIYAHYI